MMSASIISGQVISRTGRIRAFPLIGSALIFISLLLLSRVTADTDLLLVMGVMFVLGYGLGNCMQPLLLILQSAVPPRDIGVATSSATFFRQIGGTLGVAIFLSVLFGSVGGNIKSSIVSEAQSPAFQHAVQQAARSPQALDRQVAEALQRPTPGGGVLAQVQNDSSIIQQMPAALAHPFKAGFAESMGTVFLLAGAVAVLAFLVLLLMPKVELRATSASAAARSEAAPTAPVTDQV
jgi:fucose permease